MNPLLISIGLMALAIILLVIDLFIPSGGILSVFAALVGLAAIGFGFSYSTAVGGWMIIAVFSLIPAVIYFFIKYYPQTPIGRKMIIERPRPTSFGFGEGQKMSLHGLVDRVGMTRTDLNPSGKIVIESQEYEATSSTGIITAGSPVRVTDVEMGVVTVEQYDPSVFDAASLALSGEAIAKGADQSEPNQSLLDMAPEDFGLEDLDLKSDPPNTHP